MSVRLHGNFGSWVLPEGVTVLGRGSTAGLRIDDPRLSRNHARFVLHGHHLRVEEMGSTNGVLVDGAAVVGSHELANGTVVVCGPVVLMVSVDQTAPHPRTTQGQQDPGTRRNVPRSDTEEMQAIDAPTPESTPSSSQVARGINPAIAAAVASTSGIQDAAMQPAEMPPSVTSPLSAVRPDPRSAKGGAKRRSPTTSSAALEASEQDPASTGALLSPPLPPSPGVRLLAGCGDGLLAVAASLPAPAILALGYGLAMRSAGAALAEGLPVLGAEEPASALALASTLLSPGGLERALDLAPIAARHTGALLLLVGASAGAVLFAAMALLLVLAAMTSSYGAPPVHRLCGIAIVNEVDGLGLSWWRAVWRWVLAALLWPLALPIALVGLRSPHDVLSGCRLVRTR